MRAKDSFDYCYNGQIGVDENDQIIISEHLSQNENDKNELIRVALKNIKDNTGSLPDVMALDKGYSTSDNIETLDAARIDGYIASGRGEKERMPGSSKKNRQAGFFL